MLQKPQYYDEVVELQPDGTSKFAGRVTKVLGRLCYYADPDRQHYSVFIWRFGKTPNSRFQIKPCGEIPKGRSLTVLDPQNGNVFLQKRLPDGFENVQSATMRDCFEAGPERDALDPAVVAVLNRAFASGDWYVTAFHPVPQVDVMDGLEPKPGTLSGKKSYRTRTGMHVSGR